jgi:homoserine kinase type II
VEGWRPLFEKCRADADSIVAGITSEIVFELGQLESEWPRDLPYGVIHADLFPDNVFFEGTRLSGLIDFYFACNDALFYDLAVCLNAWCFEPDLSFNITKARYLISGYCSLRRCSEAEIAALPRLARGAALRFLLTRLYDWINQVDGALVKPKDPREYLHKLRFHRNVSGPAEYGIDS